MSYQVGVDLGATFTTAAVCRAGRADVVALGPGAASLPSVAYVAPDGSPVFGQAAEQRALTEPDRVARQFTRRVGDGTPLRLGGLAVTADVLTARFVAHVVNTVAGTGAGPAARVALTHPAGWGQHRLASLRAALTANGLGATVFLSAAQAAVRAHAERVPVPAGELVAVYDLGGTGFDAAVVRRAADGRFVLAGRPEELELGGLDFDELVFGHVREALGDRFDTVDPADPALRPALARLRRECALAKEALSADTDVQIPVVLPGIDTRVRLARAEFEELVRPAIEESAATMLRAVDAAGSTPDDMSAVLLTGGSARIPLVTQILSEVLGRPVLVAPNPKGDTAIGAALAIAGPDADEPAARVRPEQTRIALRAVPAPGPTPPSPARPPVPAGMTAPDAPRRARFGLSRTLAATAAAVTALAVTGGIVLAAQTGPSGAGADPEPADKARTTGEPATTTSPVTTTTEQTTPDEEPTVVQRRTREAEETPPEEETVSEPPETTADTTTTEPPTSEPPVSSQPTAPDAPADRSADPGQPERPQS
jgi:molecular chaperone DnaK (HSP70)